MAEYIFEGDVIIDGVRYKHYPMYTNAVSVEQARNNIVWKVREEYGLTKKLWVNVYIEGTLCTKEDQQRAYVRHIKLEMNKIYGKSNTIPDLPDSAKKGAEQIAFPIDELIKK